MKQAKLIKCLHKIQEELPCAYQRYAQYPRKKQILANEKEFIEGIIKNIQEFLNDSLDSPLPRLIAFAKLILAALNSITHRFDADKVIDLPTNEIQDLITELRSCLLELIPSVPAAAACSQDISQERVAYEQQKMLNQKGLRAKLIELKTFALYEKKPSKEIFVSHAWPVKCHPDFPGQDDPLQEAWSNEFVFELVSDLQAAGLVVYLDQKHSNCGSPLHEFMQNRIREANHIIVVCNRTLEFKFEKDGASGVVYEYLEIMKRWRKDKPNRFVIPLCLTKDNYIPGLIGKFAAVSTYEGYLPALKELIKHIYGFEHYTLETWWNSNIQPLADSPEFVLNSKLSKSFYSAQTPIDIKPNSMPPSVTTPPTLISTPHNKSSLDDVACVSSCSFTSVISSDRSGNLFIPDHAVNGAKSSNFIWNIPPPSPNNIKRQELACIEERLLNQPWGTQYPAVIIVGYPGVGKTHGVYDYAHCHNPKTAATNAKFKYDGGAYIFEAGDKHKLFESYKQFANKLGVLKVSEVKDLAYSSEDCHKLITTVNSRIQNQERMLLFFDSAIDFSSIQDFIPCLETHESSIHHIIITSCNKIWLGKVILPLNDYTLEEAFNYIKLVFTGQFVKYQPTDEDINKLAHILAYYPLALSQAINTIIGDHNELWTVKSYIQAYTSSKLDLIKLLSIPSLNDSEKTILRTWRIALDRFKYCYPQFLKQVDILFEVISCLNFDKIPLYFIYKYFQIKYHYIDNKQISEFIILCSRYSLLEISKINIENDSIIIPHQVFHKVLQYEYSDNKSVITNIIQFIVEYFPYDQFDETKVNEWVALYIHINYLVELFEKQNCHDSFVYLMIKINLIGFYLYEHKNYLLAEKHQEQINKYNEILINQLSSLYLGRFHLYWLMCTYGSDNHSYSEMKFRIQLAFSLFDKNNTIINIFFKILLYNFSSIYYNTCGKALDALSASQKAIETYEANKPAMNIEANSGHTRIYFNIYLHNGRLQLSNGQYFVAKSIFLNLLAYLNELDRSTRHLNYYHRVLMYLGQAEVNLGLHDSAHKYYHIISMPFPCSFKTTEVIWREEHYYKNMGELYYLQGKYLEAEKCYQVSGSLLRQIYQNKSGYDVGQHYLDIAEVKLAQEEISEADKHIQTGNKICASVFGHSCKNLMRAKLFLFQGWHDYLHRDNSKAHSHLRDSKNMFEELESTNHRFYGEVLFILSSLLEKKYKYYEARCMLKKSLAVIPPNSLLFKQVKNKLDVITKYCVHTPLIFALTMIFVYLIYTFNKLYSHLEDRELIYDGDKCVRNG